MSAGWIVLSRAESQGWGVVVIRRAWLAVASFSSRTASRALPGPWPSSARASAAAALRAAVSVRVKPASPARVAKMAVSCPGV
jgi:hypothetical protein